MEDSVSTILSEIKKIYCKLENFDDRIQTLECSKIYMDEKDLIGSSQIRTGLDPLRKDIFDLKTELKKFDLKCKNNFMLRMCSMQPWDKPSQCQPKSHLRFK